MRYKRNLFIMIPRFVCQAFPNENSSTIPPPLLVKMWVVIVPGSVESFCNIMIITIVMISIICFSCEPIGRTMCLNLYIFAFLRPIGKNVLVSLLVWPIWPIDFGIDQCVHLIHSILFSRECVTSLCYFDITGFCKKLMILLREWRSECRRGPV